MTALLNQGLKEKDLYVIISPVNGTLDQFSGIYAGSVIQAGSLLAVISPDSLLYAEVYVSPRNIGYIHKDMPVHLQIASFNYNEWGTIDGRVTDISSDFITDPTGQNTFYRVKCGMEKNYLVRKNGVKGVLKKGMSVSAHFMITRRSLFDLLYQKMDDWINPAQYEK
jgi:HlyD family secretion protein